MSEETILGLPAKYIALCALVIQNSALILTMRYSRVNATPNDQYLTSTAVVLSEAIKSFLCSLLHLRERRRYFELQNRQNRMTTSQEDALSDSSSNGIRQIITEIYGSDSGFVKMIFPAALYTLQDNLQFIAASNLDPATHQVTYQGKILTTAIFAVILLNKRLSSIKWLALLLLTLGVAAVQIPTNSTLPTASGSSSVDSGNRVIGFAAVSCACITSGLAGVYFEKVLKGSSNQNKSSAISNAIPPSLWTRSLQLSTGSFVFAFVHAFAHDGSAIREKGFFHGYSINSNPAAIAAVFMQATCGLIVAMVIKYADNILKGFATSMSVVLSTVASVWLFGFIITQYFIGGAALVILATWIYGLPDRSNHGNVASARPVQKYADEEKGSNEEIEMTASESMPNHSREMGKTDVFQGHDLLY